MSFVVCLVAAVVSRNIMAFFRLIAMLISENERAIIFAFFAGLIIYSVMFAVLLIKNNQLKIVLAAIIFAASLLPVAYIRLINGIGICTYTPITTWLNKLPLNQYFLTLLILCAVFGALHALCVRLYAGWR
jgi:hypothetical protein